MSALLAASTGCGGSGGEGVNRQQFAANAASLIGQLHDDLASTEDAGRSVASARRVLGNQQELLMSIVAFADFGSCRQMVQNAGTPTGRLKRVEATLRSACGVLERASQLFSNAASHSDPYALLAATATMLKASPLLYRAQVELAAARH